MRKIIILGLMLGILTSPGLFLPPDVFAAAPAQVGTVSMTPNKTSITLSWSAPASQGADITDYIVKFRDVTEGDYDSKFGSSGTGDGQFDNPNGIAIDGSGNIYVVDSDNHRVQKFNSAGVFQSEFGSSGTGNGQFNTPTGIVIDSSGNIYVVDAGNHRIQKFNSSHSFVLKWGSQGTGNAQFNDPAGIAIKDNRIYVADSGNDRIMRYDNTGTFENKFGSSGTNNGQFDNPRGIAFDS